MVEPFIDFETVDVQSIYLDVLNPRHNELKTEDEVISYLCDAEQIASLAEDIVKYGLNPLERWALLVDEPDKTGDSRTYIVLEGNRRLCALKLLIDAERAPRRLRKRFEHLSANWDNVQTIDAAIFEDRGVARKWIERNHGGAMGGIGRRTWDADQKSRFTGDNKHKMAQDILDYAEANGFISAVDRHRKLTTVSRYLSNRNFRDALGILQNAERELYRTTPKEDFDQLLRHFMCDLVDGDVNSRQNKSDVERYVVRLVASADKKLLKLEEPEPVFVQQIEPDTNKKKRPRPQKPRPLRHINHSIEIAESLERTGSRKLILLYHSICKVRLDHHATLLAVGVWTFFECLAALDNCETNFVSYFTGRLRTYGLVDKGNNKSIKDALKNVSAYGNKTKHHQIAAQFDGEQLANDMEVLSPLIVAVLMAKGDGTPNSSSS